jgi:hypothetical protein
VERTDGRLKLPVGDRRPATGDYKTLPTRSEGVIHLAMTDLVAANSPAIPPSPGATRHHEADPVRDLAAVR